MSTKSNTIIINNTDTNKIQIFTWKTLQCEGKNDRVIVRCQLPPCENNGFTKFLSR